MHKMMLFLTAIFFSMSAMAIDFNETQILANRGDANAQYSVGLKYLLGQGVPQDYYKASKWFEKSALQGNSSAQALFGDMYYTGIVFPQNYVLAKEWFEKSAIQENAYAQTFLGAMYNNGHGVPQDADIAKKWFGKACDNGSQMGCAAYKSLNQK